MAPRCGCGCSTPPSSGPATGSTSTTWAGRPSATRVPATDLLVLGAGPAGVGAAFRAARAGHRVVVLERGQGPGGAAGSFELDGIRVDHGSHRLHPAIEPRILADLRGLLGEELQRRPRNGRIFLEGRWIRFPLRPADLARRLPPSFAAAAARDAATAWARRPRADTFAEVLRAGLGPTMCERFYFPYARKLWGLDPSELAGEQARRRVTAGSPARLLARVARGADGGGAFFWYPRRGFGTIGERLAEAAEAAGAELRFGAAAERVWLGDRGRATVTLAGGETVTARRVWSTIPLPVLARIAEPAPPASLLAAAGRLDFRAMLLVYLVLDGGRYSPYDAHYLPDPGTPVTRVSEPTNTATATNRATGPCCAPSCPASGAASCGGPPTASSPAWCARPCATGACRSPPSARWRSAGSRRSTRCTGSATAPPSTPSTPGRPRSPPCSASAGWACSSTTTPTTPWRWRGRRPTPSPPTAASTTTPGPPPGLASPATWSRTEPASTAPPPLAQERVAPGPARRRRGRPPRRTPSRAKPTHSKGPSAAGSVSSRSRNPRSSSANARSVRLSVMHVWSYGRRLDARWRGVQLAPDGGGDPPQVGGGADERPADGPPAVADRHLQVAVALGQQVQGEHLGVVVVVDDLGVGGGGPRQRPVAALPVADRGAGHPAEQPGQQPVAGPPVGQHALDLAGEPGPDHVVGPPLQDGRDQAIQLARVVLAVGVAEGDRRGAPPHGRRQPGADGRAEPAVGAGAEHHRARPGGQRGRAVAGAVVDDQALDPPAEHQRRHPPDHRRDGRLLVVGGQEQHHRPGARRGSGGGRDGRRWQAEGHAGLPW